MSEDADSMGPVDYIVVEFSDTRFSGEPLSRLVDLVDGGLVRILDLVVLRKEADGSLTVLEITDVDGDGELDLRVFEGAPSGIVDGSDIEEAAEVIAPGRAAAILLYENLWAIPFATALRRSGAELVASGRVPLAALLDSIDAAEAGANPVGA